MNAGSSTTLSLSSIPKASCFVAVCSALPVLWLFVFAGPADEYGFVAVYLSLSLAFIALVMGLLGLFVARPYGYSIAGTMLGGIVVVFWGFLFLSAIVTAMIALP